MRYKEEALNKNIQKAVDSFGEEELNNVMNVFKEQKIAVDIEATGLELSGEIKKKHIVVIGGPVSMGTSQALKFAKNLDLSYGNHANTKEDENKDLKEAEKHIRREYLGLDVPPDAINNILLHVNSLIDMEAKIKNYYYDPLEHHKGKKDPCGLRQQFNRNGKRFK